MGSGAPDKAEDGRDMAICAYSTLLLLPPSLSLLHKIL